MSVKQTDNSYMKRCFELAVQGHQSVSPNPMVGAVLVHKNRIIGEGYHQQYGREHAEVNAINSVKEKDKHLISQCSLYVSLEPCSHHGKTPPCSDLIIQSQIPRVVIGCIDTFSEVAGKGIEKLRAHNIEVVVGVLEEEARSLNKRFFTYHEQKRPYIILKWAQTTDGFMDKTRDKEAPHINWITQPETQQLTHQWRAEEDAILVGHQTVINDNPSLTVRAVDGANPTRIVLTSSSEQFTNQTKVLDQSAPTLFLDPKRNTTKEILKGLYNESVQSVIVEGGKKTLERFINDDLWDEARILTGQNIFNNGIKAPQISGKLINQFTFGKDLIQVYEND